MSKFSLAGLLRARTVQEEQARRSLGQAQAHLTAAAGAVQHRRAALVAAGMPTDAHASVFLAGVAARSSIAASVNEAIALRQNSVDGLDQARSDWLQARMRARAIERLAERHREAEQLDVARAEQAASDDLAGARHAARQPTPQEGS